VASALTGLRLFGIDIPAHPTWEQVQAEYEAVWQTLDGRPIESLIDLPLMDRSGQQAAMQVLSTLLDAAYFTDFHLFCLLVCRMANVATQPRDVRGVRATPWLLGDCARPRCFTVIGRDIVPPSLPVTLRETWLHRLPGEGLPFDRDHGPLTQPITTALDFNQAAYRAQAKQGI